MPTYEEHITILESSKDLPSDTVEAASEAISFVAALHDLYVTQGVLNEDAPIDVGVLENLVDAYHGELAVAAILLSDDMFSGVPEYLKTTGQNIDTEDEDNVVPVVIKKGYARLANRIEQTRKLKKQMVEFAQAHIEQKEKEKLEKVDLTP